MRLFNSERVERILEQQKAVSGIRHQKKVLLTGKQGAVMRRLTAAMPTAVLCAVLTLVTAIQPTSLSLCWKEIQELNPSQRIPESQRIYSCPLKTPNSMQAVENKLNQQYKST